ncbi:MAG: hypothetical protein K6G85_09475 [Eubacterium sp.]|nr:hypothetical protein [Eubacterium sp.]
MIAKRILLNSKIYILFLGSVIALLLWKLLDIDFSFYEVDYQREAFGTLFLFYCIHDIKRFGLVLLLQKMKYRKIVYGLILGWIGVYGTLVLLVSVHIQGSTIINRLVYIVALYALLQIVFSGQSRKRIHVGTILLFLLNCYIQVILKIFL